MIDQNTGINPNTPVQAGTVATTWELRTYDVWGNAKEGFDVNDVFRAGHVLLDIPATRYNVGTESEFICATPTDKQIRSVFGLGRVQIETEGDDMTIYVSRRRDGYPEGEMHCTSHESLSPVQAKV